MLKEKPVNRMGIEPRTPVWEQRKTDAPAAPVTRGGGKRCEQYTDANDESRPMDDWAALAVTLMRRSSPLIE